MRPSPRLLLALACLLTAASLAAAARTLAASPAPSPSAAPDPLAWCDARPNPAACRERHANGTEGGPPMMMGGGGWPWMREAGWCDRHRRAGCGDGSGSAPCWSYTRSDDSDGGWWCHMRHCGGGGCGGGAAAPAPAPASAPANTTGTTFPAPAPAVVTKAPPSNASSAPTKTQAAKVAALQPAPLSSTKSTP